MVDGITPQSAPVESGTGTPVGPTPPAAESAAPATPPPPSDLPESVNTPPAADGADTPPPAEGSDTSRGTGDSGTSSAADTLSGSHDAGHTPPAGPDVPSSDYSYDAADNYYLDDGSMSPEFQDLLAKAQNGDPEAQAKIQQYVDQQAQVARTFQEQLAAQSQMVDQQAEKAKEGDAKFEDAKRQSQKLAALEKAVTPPPQPKAAVKNPARQTWQTRAQAQARTLTQTRQVLDREIKGYESRKAAAVASAKQAQLEGIIKSRAAQGKPLTEADIRGLQQRFPGMVRVVNGQPMTVRPDGKKVPMQARTAQPQSSTGKKVATATKGKELGKEKEGEGETAGKKAVAKPSAKDVKAAEAAVAARVPDQVRAERKARFDERREKLAKVKGALAEARGDVDFSAAGGQLKGAKVLALKQAQQDYAFAHRRGLDDLEGGQCTLQGAVVFGREQSGPFTPVTGRTPQEKMLSIMGAEPGTPEFYAQRADFNRMTTTHQAAFTPDHEPHGGAIFGYFSHWTPRSPDNTRGAHLQEDYLSQRRA